MSKNKIKYQEVSSEEKPKGKTRKKWSLKLPKDTSVGSVITAIGDGTFLTKNVFIKFFPLFLFIALLTLIYIANSYWAIKNYREISNLKKELKELRFEHITTKSEFMNSSKQSEIAKKLDSIGVYESLVPPVKIKVNKSEKAEK